MITRFLMINLGSLIKRFAFTLMTLKRPYTPGTRASLTAEISEPGHSRQHKLKEVITLPGNMDRILRLIIIPWISSKEKMRSIVTARIQTTTRSTPMIRCVTARTSCRSRSRRHRTTLETQSMEISSKFRTSTALK